MVACLMLGAVWGALSSFTNAEASPFGVAVAVVVNAGWAWAGVAVAAGWVVRTVVRGAAAGVLALIAMTTAYYGMDSILSLVSSRSAAWSAIRRVESELVRAASSRFLRAVVDALVAASRCLLSSVVSVPALVLSRAIPTAGCRSAPWEAPFPFGLRECRTAS